MPLYEYQCEACGERFEVIRKFSDPPLEVCTRCGHGPVTRLFSSPAIQFKGAGFYITDYAKKGEGGKAEGGKAETKKADTAPSDAGTKTETKSDSGARSDSSAASAPAKTSGPAKD